MIESRAVNEKVVARLDKFIENLHERNIVMTAKAKELDMKTVGGKTVTFAMSFAHKMHAYELMDRNAMDRTAVSYFLEAVDIALVTDVIADGSGSSEKIKQLEAEVAKLKQENNDLRKERDKASEDLVFIQGRYEELNEKFDRMLPKKDDVGV